MGIHLLRRFGVLVSRLPERDGGLILIFGGMQYRLAVGGQRFGSHRCTPWPTPH
jgi:hypothetical protein